MAASQNVLPVSLLDLLSNDLILRHSAPYIGIQSLQSLAATSKAYNSLIYDTPHVFHHVDLHHYRMLGWDAQRYSTMFKVLENRNVMQDVRTLILDELYVPITVVENLLCNDRYGIHLLSLRDSVTRPQALAKIFHHLVRPSRPKGTPKLQGLYLFSRRNRPMFSYEFLREPQAGGITASSGAQLGASNYMDNDRDDSQRYFEEDPYNDSPYGVPGLSRDLDTWSNDEWPKVLEACVGVIAFDAVLCRHPAISRPSLATVRLNGCKSCGSCPEGPAYPGVSPPDRLPLLSPPPLHSSKVEVAQRIDTAGQPFPPLILRCRTCLKNRWCETCNAWWCESCYTVPKSGNLNKSSPASVTSCSASNGEIKGTERHCYECGQQCQQCQKLTQRACASCPNEFCVEHDTGCSQVHCAWCNTGGRRGALLDY
ncbi:hypothetical protein BDR22DRAFT_364842 [Usnea florida]